MLVFGFGEVGRHATGQNDSDDGEDGDDDRDFADQGHVLVDYLGHLVVAPLAIDLRLVLDVAVEPLAARSRHGDRARQVAPVPVPVVAAALQLNETVNQPPSERNRNRRALLCPASSRNRWSALSPPARSDSCCCSVLRRSRRRSGGDKRTSRWRTRARQSE